MESNIVLTTSICILESISVSDFLVQNCGISKSQIKKSDLSKKYLNKIIYAKNELSLPLDLVNYGLIHPDYVGPEISVIFENENFLVLDKPANQHCFPHHYHERSTILNFVRARFFNLIDVDSDHHERGLLYRLDSVTSGVLIYIKNDEQFQNLRKNFNQVVKTKLYRAWVEGEFKHSVNSELFYQGSMERGHKTRVAETGNDLNKGLMLVTPIRYENANNKTLVEIKLMTGHRHQIRAGLSFYGFPIIGDELYGSVISSHRVYLHAYSYQLEGTPQFVSESQEFI